MNKEAMEAADLEGTTNVMVDELSNQEGEITLDDLRNLPGAKDMDDADLQKLWDDVKSEAGSTDAGAGTSKAKAEAVAAATGGEAVQTARGWKVYGDDGKEISDLSKLSADQFLKSKIGYNANKAEQRKSFDELLRVVQFGHLNEKKVGSLQSERDQFFKELSELRPQLENHAKINTEVKRAVTQYLMGNDKPLATLIEQFKTVIAGEGGSAGAGGGVPIDRSNDNRSADGQRIWYEEIQPMTDAVAAKFGAIQNEVRAAVRRFMETEPVLTREKLDSYINEEIPLLLQQAGYKEVGARAANAIPVANAEVESMRKRIQELEAAQKNGNIAAVRDRMKNIPSASRGDSVIVTDEDEALQVPKEALKGKAAFKKFLRE
jgi:hypothetical protein